MRRTRYQGGTVQLDKRCGVWRFRWWDRSNGKPVRRSADVGTLEQFPTEARALRAAALQRARINGEVGLQNSAITIGKVAESYIAEEMPPRFATRKAYLCNLNNHILPRWGETQITKIVPMQVECWLSGLKYSAKTKVHLRNLVRILVDSAMRRGWIEINRNPIELVRVRGLSRKQRRLILTAEQFRKLLGHLPAEPLRTMVIGAMCLGLRSSELFALKWSDIDWEQLTISVRRSIVDGHVDDVKTVHSSAVLPLDPAVAEVLLGWKRKTEFSAADDWVFASPYAGGKLPFLARGLQQRALPKAAQSAGLGWIGWHTFRHSYRALLGNSNAPMDVQRDLMRHASIVTTIDTYGDTVPSSLRAANGEIVKQVLIGPQMDHKGS